MSRPFFIWTMRRTGGTSLTTLLTEISEYRGVQHEPFNSDRIYGNFIKEFRKNLPREKLLTELDKIFEDRVLIKHCYELFGKDFNDLLIEATSKYEYKYIFLEREDEISRILSLALAKQTSVWGPEQKKGKYEAIISGAEKLAPFDIKEMTTHYKWCKNITDKVKSSIKERDREFKAVKFEDFYTGDREDRLMNLRELFSYLEFGEEMFEKHSDKIEKALFNSSQNSRDILKYVPNYKEAIEALRNVSM